MKQIMFISLILILIFIAGCSKEMVRAGYRPPADNPTTPTKDVDEMDQQKCKVDSDCVPIPSCHPRACINKEFQEKYRKPDMCTEMFDCSAAYDAEDCLCVEGKCKNSNIGKSCE